MNKLQQGQTQQMESTGASGINVDMLVAPA
jgi:hypothetical protein